MRFTGNLETNVGQVLKDLEVIVKSSPDGVLSYPFYYDWSTENYITGTRVLRNGILLLEGTPDEDDALTVEELLHKLKKYDSEQKVVIQDGWRLLNLEHYDSWDEDFECNESSVIVMDTGDEDEICVGTGCKDIRLHSLGWLKEELKDRFGDCQDRRIVGLDEDGEVYPLSDYHHDTDNEAGCDYLFLSDENGIRSLKVSDFLSLNYSGENWSEEHWGVAINYTENGEDYVLRAIEVDEEGNSFFKADIDGEDVIACRLGDIIRGDEMFEVIDAPEVNMTKDGFIDYLKHTYIPELKERIEKDREIADRDEDDFECEFEDDEYVTCIAMAEGRARAGEIVVRELESLLEKLDR